MPSSTDKNKLIMGKKKNGHKMDCQCHICENMKAKANRNGYEEDLNRERERKMGKRKQNGHKMECKCIICKNINNKSMKNKNKTLKKNNHKCNCKCPICKNMKHNKTNKK
jgi:hypothetical protein